MKKSMQLGKKILSCILTAALVLGVVPMTAIQTNAVEAQQVSGFVNGPYLLAPKTDSMVVVWETTKATKSKIYYGTDENSLKSMDVAVQEGLEYKGEKMQMFRAKLKDLKPATNYIYRVELENGEKAGGTFKTLSTNPSEVKFVVVSDTHKFETAKQVSDAVKTFKPDFILHTGDTVEGTGTQKEQFTYWFKNNGDFLSNVPVIYNCGNHDFGPYFDEYVTKTQKEEYRANANGRNISFEYGKAHFTMMDSTPWSLFELNSAASGNVDAATRKLVDDSLSWLKNDLASSEAKGADFRVLTMHHPYEDDLTRKYIPPIAENGNVNVLFGGHTHVYARTASPNAERALRTMYVTQGDARIGDSKIDTGKEGVRVNENFPEVLATGKGDMLQVTIKDGILSYSNVGLKDGKEAVLETVALSKDEPKLKFEDISITPDSILSNGKVEVSAKVTNEGKGMAAAVLTVNDNGKDRYLYTFGQKGSERVVALEPGKSAVLKSELTLEALGKHTLKLADYTKTVDVQFRKATYTYSNLRTKLGNGAVSDLYSDILNVKADVTNIGNEKGTAEVVLYVNDKAVDTKKYTIEAGKTKTAEFKYDFATYGDFKVRIGDSDAQTVTIAGTIQGTPIVKDKSGLGNNALLRGNPTLVKYDKGYGLSLDGVDDYIEIPDRQNYKVDDGVTGMVWANIDRLANKGEWDHNPLMMKGASISYGTNYLFRMAMRATGKITYGIGFDDDNGEFFWNDDGADTAGAKLGKWTQYTGAFDRKTGGVSWQDTVVSGQIDPPDFNSPIKNWEGKSMYIGFSFHRHMLNGRDRGRTHTMLTGDVGQVRFYNTKLTETTNQAIFANPSAKGAQSDKLVMWLDFNPSNIIKTGYHTTEWVKVSDKAAALNFDTEIPGAASMTANVQVSDDGKTVKASKAFKLANGKGTLDLKSVPSGKYVRISTTLVTSMTEKATDIPVLKEYVLDAGSKTTWSTLADWKRGKFRNAIGHQNTDIFKDYAVDFDDYTGKADAPDTGAVNK